MWAGGENGGITNCSTVGAGGMGDEEDTVALVSGKDFHG